MRSCLAVLFAASLATSSAPASAQTDPLPTLPAPSSPPPPPPANPPPPPPAPAVTPASPPPGVVYAPPPPAQYGYVPPPPGPAMVELEPVRAPKYSLWLGGRLGLLLFGGSMYINPNTGNDEQTSAFVTNGLALEADVGARISKRYIPYLALELGLVGPGTRFQGTSASAGTSFLGLGFRFLAGNVNFVSFASDLSFGFRKFEVANAGSTWTASAFEFLRLGLGADIRFTDYFTISPMVTLSGGTLASTSGSVTFAPNQSDGTTGTPPQVNNGQIPSSLQTNYYAIVLGCGAHFDLFGAH